jgi:uncharacterized damage-inducible protein DinB
MKDVLVTQAVDAFAKNPEMSLLCSVQELSQKEAEWKLNETTWSIEEILFHVASCKFDYCKQGFGLWKEACPKPFGNVNEMIKLNQKAHDHLMECLRQLPEARLQEAIPTAHHGESAAHFFWIMAMHDISHGAQIRTIRRAYGSRTDFYPVR